MEEPVYSTGVSFGSSVVPLIYVEVVPLLFDRTVQADGSDPQHPSFSAASVKLELLRSTIHSSLLPERDQSSLSIEWTPEDPGASGSPFCTGKLFRGDISESDSNGADEGVSPILYLQQGQLASGSKWPCLCVGYAAPKDRAARNSPVIVTEATLVRILPLGAETPCFQVPLWKEQLTGEWEEPLLSTEMESEVLENQNPETVKELSLRMEMLLSHPVLVGTTADALLLHHRRQQRTQAIRATLKDFVDESSAKQVSLTSNSANKMQRPPSMFREGALIVHSPDHGAGKNLLVEAIARRHLKCGAVYVIRPGPLMAKYGTRADAALETILHQILVRTAFRQESVCIVLDHLDAMMPPVFSGKASAGDAAVPVLNAVASLLKNLTLGLQRSLEFPFPSSNPLYNLNARQGSTLAVRLCLVAVVTCPDDGWRSARGNDSTLRTACIFDSLVAGRYRLPALTASTRLSALLASFRRENVPLSCDLEQRLPFLAASAVWAKGSMFRRLARQAKMMSADHGGLVEVDTVVSALASIGKTSSAGTEVRFLAQDNAGSDFFSTVGGNEEAKMALEDALALDNGRQRMLDAFGILAPTGILLFGPPGTGKTLLAKAVARLLRSLNTHGSSIGGAFVSLSSSDIVRAEIGSGEKMVVLAFETARMNAPSVVFIDEFQALFTDRSSGGSGRLSTTLLQCMDDVKRWRLADKSVSSSERDKANGDGRVVVLAATNTPWMVDKAFLRPGRFDRVVHVGLPSVQDRVSILRLHMGRMKMKLGEDVHHLERTCVNLAECTQGFSGADLAALCRAAAVRCLLENGEYVEERHFVEAQEHGLAASSSRDFVERIRLWNP